MSRITLNSTDKGSVIRAALNTMFEEIYNEIEKLGELENKVDTYQAAYDTHEVAIQNLQSSINALSGSDAIQEVQTLSDGTAETDDNNNIYRYKHTATGFTSLPYAIAVKTTTWYGQNVYITDIGWEDESQGQIYIYVRVETPPASDDDYELFIWAT